MDSSINIIDDLQNNIINRDCNCDDIGELNKCMALGKEVILNVNIRGLNANFNKLLIFIKSLVIKPCIIISSRGGRYLTIFRDVDISNENCRYFVSIFYVPDMYVLQDKSSNAFFLGTSTVLTVAGVALLSAHEHKQLAPLSQPGNCHRYY